MEEAQHTPWSFNSKLSEIFDSEDVMVCLMTVMPVGDEHAAFIVRAVNSQWDLMTALELFLVRDGSDLQMDCPCRACDMGRAALAKARVG